MTHIPLSPRERPFLRLAAVEGNTLLREPIDARPRSLPMPKVDYTTQDAPMVCMRQNAGLDCSTVGVSIPDFAPRRVPRAVTQFRNPVMRSIGKNAVYIAASLSLLCATMAVAQVRPAEVPAVLTAMLTPR